MHNANTHTLTPTNTCIHTHTFTLIFTKNLCGLKSLPYNHRLAILKQPTLQSRRTRADLIYLFKILNGFVVNDLKQLFVLSSTVSVCDMQLRGYAFKLFVPKPRTDMLKFGLFITFLNIGTLCQL